MGRTNHIDRTEGCPTNQCKECRRFITQYGAPYKWTYFEGHGPFCEDCVKKGVTVTIEGGTMNKKGFTLIELLIVIMIIGVLAGIAIPKLMEYRRTKGGIIEVSKEISKEIGKLKGSINISINNY